MSDDLVARAIQVIAKTQQIPPETVTIDKTFEELKIDSLDGINILFALEGEFDIYIPDDPACRSGPFARWSRESKSCSRLKKLKSKNDAPRRGHRHRRDSAPGTNARPFGPRCGRRSAIRPLTLVPEGTLRFPNAAEVPDYSPSDYFEEKEADLLDRFAQFAVIAAREAVADRESSISPA